MAMKEPKVYMEPVPNQPGAFRQARIPMVPPIPPEQREMWICEVHNMENIGQPITVCVNGVDKATIPAGVPVLLTKGQIEALQHTEFIGYDTHQVALDQGMIGDMQLRPVKKWRFVVTKFRKATMEEKSKAKALPTRDILMKEGSAAGSE